MVSNASESSARNVLIVEDDRFARELLTRVLGKLGFHVFPAGTLRDAIDLAGALHLTHVILDLNLPDGSGTALLRQMRGAGLPVKVAITTAVSSGDRFEEAISLAPDAHYTKPVDLLSLIAWLSDTAPAQN
jgi:two-component system response regulator TctD